MSPISRLLSVFALLGAAACASSSDPAPAPAPAPAAQAAAPAPAAPAPAPAAAEEAEAIFSTTQSNRGRDQFRSMCTECHTANEFSDNTFQLKWSRRSVGDLFEFILTAMPDDSPGILTASQAVDLTTYILSMNGFETGSATLRPDQGTLDGISLSRIRS